MINKDKILILGASGFIGSEVLKSFSKNKDVYELYAVEHHSKVVSYQDVEIIQGSLFDVPKILEKIKPTIVIHAARISGKNQFFGREWASFVGGYANKKIYKKIVEINCKLVFVSGSLMYGSHKGKRVTECFKLKPVSFAKAYYKSELPFVENKKNANIMILRPGWVFGDDSWYKVFYKEMMNNYNYVPQYGAGDNCMSIIHVEDLGRLIMEYALRFRYTFVYNLCSPINISHYMFVKTLSEIYKKEIKIFLKHDVIKKFGRVVYDALCSDIHLATIHTEIVDDFEYNYKKVEDLLI